VPAEQAGGPEEPDSPPFGRSASAIRCAAATGPAPGARDAGAAGSGYPCRRRTISAIQTGANGEVQPGGVG
jgi:hypothetical protein